MYSAKKPVICDRKSRLLHHAPARLGDFLQALGEYIDGFTEIEGANRDMLQEVVLFARRISMEARERFAWCNESPYSNVTQPAVANRIWRDWERIPRARQHRVTVRNMLEWGQVIFRIGQGAAV